MKSLILPISGLLLGLLLSSMGYSLKTWQYWAVFGLVALAIFGALI